VRIDLRRVVGRSLSIGLLACAERAVPVARSIPDALGGDIGYEAIPGGGACFTLTLPTRTS
jgi:K+-sensing histidine kinase KdpD